MEPKSMGRKLSAASPPKLLASVPSADPSQADGFVRNVAATVMTPNTLTPSSIDALPTPQDANALARPGTDTPRARGMVKRKRGPDAARVVAYLPADLGDKLIMHCASTRRTVSDGVVEAVRQWLEQVQA